MERFNTEKILGEEVGILDNNSEWLGIPKSHLMECAGFSFATEVVKRYNLNESSKVAIFCGTGNNGGDGFVVARHLSSFGVKSIVILVGIPERIRSPEACLNWNIVSKSLTYSIDTEIIRDATDLEATWQRIRLDKNISLLIDGLLGTGIKGKIREPISFGIEVINSLKNDEKNRLQVVSIDVPSGLDPNTGEVPDKAVIADLVITFHRAKKGMEEGTEYIKELVVKPIGVPFESELFVGRGDFLPTLKTRKQDSHKGEFGKLLVIGGSKDYSGAPAYSSLTGIKFGIDLVITYVPDVIGDIIRKYSPNYIVRTSPGDWLNLKALDDVKIQIEWADAIIIGPGMGQQKETEKFLVKVLEFLKDTKKPFVLDADALKLIKDHLDLIKGQNVILTPHEGELKILTEIEFLPDAQVSDKMKIISELATKLEITILLKGQYDYISNGDSLKLNRTGCPEMSIGGTGDVLAGLCGCFLATDNDTFKSACSAAFLNGLIGEHCKNEIGSRFTAVDMINAMNKVIASLKN